MQLTGDLSKVSLPNLIQLVRNGELTGKIAFLQGAKTATIYVEKGSIVHVESDGAQGRDALLDLFLWMSGSFSFEEAPASVTRTINPVLPEEATDRLLREGMAYLEQKKYLDQLRIGGQTILKPTELVARAGKNLLAVAAPVLERIDGRKTLAQALADSSILRREYVLSVYVCLTEGLAVVVETPIQPGREQISLPPWVLARLNQDNPNISQAIVDMVIWVDRVKCWMYQVDSDFGRIINDLAKNIDSVDSDEDFFKELGQETADYQGPFFGESMPGSGAESESSASESTEEADETPAPRTQSPTPKLDLEKIKSMRKPPSIEF